MGQRKKNRRPAQPGQTAGPIAPGYVVEARLEALLWEAYGYFDVDKVEARKVSHLADMALAQRAQWMVDVTAAVWGGDGLKTRLRALVKADEPEDMSESEQLKHLGHLAKAIPPQQGQALQKQLDFIEYCRKRGITWK